MSSFEIALIIIGIICIIASCFFIDHKKEDTVETELGTVTEQILYSQLSEANDQINSHINQLKEEVMEATKDEMSRISNEKILAIHEYSEQVMADIKKNHEEVLFLYQMLNDKQEELKQSLNQMQHTKREVERYLSMAEDEMVGSKENLSNSFRENTGAEMTNHIAGGDRKKTKAVSNDQHGKNRNLLEVADIDQDSHYSKTLQEIENQEFSSHIDEILELSNQGYSIIEISKRLGMGQGEVQLVLNYNKK